MGLFDKEKLKDLALKAKDTAINAYNEAKEEEARKKELGLLPDVSVNKLEYKGGHPELTKEKDCVLQITNDDVTIACGKNKAMINYEDVTNVQLETTEQISKRITATRIVALGVFALAFKKKEKDTTKYLTIDYNEAGLENTVLIGGKNVAEAHSHLYKHYVNYLKRKQM